MLGVVVALSAGVDPQAGIAHLAPALAALLGWKGQIGSFYHKVVITELQLGERLHVFFKENMKTNVGLQNVLHFSKTRNILSITSKKKLKI